MEKLVETLELLRNAHKFRGYIHVKAIPGADRALIDRAAALADRMSANIELPSESSLKLLAPQKKREAILSPMRLLSDTYISYKEEPRGVRKIPAGQTTQMIIGASPDPDGQILRLSEGLYRIFKLKRVYYSSYVPVNTGNSLLPVLPADARREHRLYEADWLLRFYGYNADELLPQAGFLNLDLDVKSDWAVRNYANFPLEINAADYEKILRVPGIGVKNAYRITEARRHGKLDWDALKRMRVVLGRAKHFITINGKFFGASDDPQKIKNSLRGFALTEPAKGRQLGFFDTDIVKGEF
jgi:Predicted DNA-binding protein with the Helix-hairpin-helix motif